MLKLKKGLAWLITLVMLAGVMPMTMVQASYEQLETKAGVTRIGVLSDTHLRTTDGSDKLISALGQFATIDPNYAGLALVGDIVMQNGNVNNDYEVYTEPYEVVTGILAEHAKDKPYFWSMGNHEFPLACVLKVSQSEEQTAKMEAAIATSKEYYTQYTGMDLHSDKTIGGYHFISADQIDYSNVMDAEGEEWMMQQIDAAIDADGNEKPIFLSLHHAPWETTVSSTETAYDNPYSETFTNYLATKPNVIVLTGHTHASEYLPQAIWNDGGYTVVNLGHTSNGSNVRSEGVMLEIENNVVRIRRMDFVNQEYIGEDWVLDIPNMVKNPGDAAYWKYTDARANAVEAPAFAADAVVTASGETESSTTITFPQATGYQDADDDLIRSYRIKVVNKKLQTLVQDYTVNAQYYTPPAERSATLTATISSLNAGTDYAVEVSALNTWGDESASISGTFSTTSATTDDDTTEETEITYANDTREKIVIPVAIEIEDQTATEGYDNSVDGHKYNYNSIAENLCGRQAYRNPASGFEENLFMVFYESAMYMTFEFEVEKDGLYDLRAMTATALDNQLISPVLDQVVIPYTIPNTGGQIPTYNSLGVYPLSAGTHQITMKLPQNAGGELYFYGFVLAKAEETYMISQSISESDITANHANINEKTSNGYPLYVFYGGAAANFTANVEQDGEYSIYLIGSTWSSEENVTVSLDGNSLFTEKINTEALQNVRCMKLSGKIPMTADTHKIRITSDSESGHLCVSAIAIVKNPKWTQKRVVYNTTNTEATFFENSGNGKVDGAAFGMGNGCYVTYQLTPQVTGRYSITHFGAANSAEIKTAINGETVATQTHDTNGSGVLANATALEPISAILVAGETYDINVSKLSGGTFTFVYSDFVLDSELTSGDGIYYDLFAGEYDDTNVEEITEESSWPRWGDGRGDYGYSMYGTRYISYDVNIEYAGWYDVSLTAKCPATVENPASVSVYVDGALKNTIEDISQGDGKLVNDLGEIFLLEGTHTIKILNNNGDMDYFKTRISFAEEDDGTAPIEFVYDSHSYTDKGGSNVQTPTTNGYNAIVLGEGNSYAEYTVDVPAGNYIFSICYGSSDWDGRAKITVNGGLLGTYSLPQNNTFIGRPEYDTNAYYAPEVLSLNEGINTIKIMCAQFKDSTDYAYFSYSTFKLTRVTTPEVLMYSGEYITPDGRIDALEAGTVTLRNYLPTYMENKAVTVVACIYENGRLYKVDTVSTNSAEINDILISQFKDISMNSEKTYTLKTFYIDELGNMEPLCESVPVV